jgi:hypothetical protein
MMVGVDETRYDDVTAVTQNLVGLVAAGEISVCTHLDDPAIALEDSAVLDDLCPIVVGDPANDVLTANQRR